jgi:hypothetical protein
MTSKELGFSPLSRRASSLYSIVNIVGLARCGLGGPTSHSTALRSDREARPPARFACPDEGASLRAHGPLGSAADSHGWFWRLAGARYIAIHLRA